MKKIKIMIGIITFSLIFITGCNVKVENKETINEPQVTPIVEDKKDLEITDESLKEENGKKIYHASVVNHTNQDIYVDGIDFNFYNETDGLVTTITVYENQYIAADGSISVDFDNDMLLPAVKVETEIRKK